MFEVLRRSMEGPWQVSLGCPSELHGRSIRAEPLWASRRSFRGLTEILWKFCKDPSEILTKRCYGDPSCYGVFSDFLYISILISPRFSFIFLFILPPRKKTIFKANVFSTTYVIIYHFYRFSCLTHS